MVFIYPAIVSENCDPRIVPAVAKSIERFFLVQLQDAFSSGVLTAKRKYEPGKGNYGPLLLESLNNYNRKQYLLENKYNFQKSVLMEMFDARKYRSEIEALRNRFPLIKLEQSEETRKRAMDEADDLRSRIAEDDNLSNNEKEQLYLLLNNFERMISDADSNAAQRSKNRKDEKSKSSSIGSYRAMETKIDIVPTGATVNIPVLFFGGPNAGKYDKDVEVNINVKVIPTIVKNFADIESAMMDDYFTKQSESFFKSIGRNIVRKVKGILGRFGPLGDYVASKIGKDQVEKEVIYNSQGFVDASAFHKSSHSPNNYNYTSNVVIFNKDDLSDPDDGNIFQNRSAMQKMFKLGWSTFAMLDPVDEVMYFISSLDGGYMHELPYRYMMESIGSKAYYGNENALKGAARPFMINKGNFSTFCKQFN